MRRTTITLPEELVLLLQREARRRRTSMSQVARTALSEHFELGGERPRAVPFAAVASSRHADTSERAEEILDAEWATHVSEDRADRGRGR